MTNTELLSPLTEIARDLAVDPATGRLRDFDRTTPFVRPAVVAEHPAHGSFLAILEEDAVLGGVRDSDTLAASLINAALWASVMDDDASAAAFESSLAKGEV